MGETVLVCVSQPCSLSPCLCCTGIVHPGLNDFVDGDSAFGDQLAEPAVHLLGEELGHVVVVFGQIWVLLIQAAPVQSQRQLGHALLAAQTQPHHTET